MITVNLPNTDGPDVTATGVLRFSGHADVGVRRRIWLTIYESREVEREPGVRGRDALEQVSYVFGITYGSSWKHERTQYLAAKAGDIADLNDHLTRVDPTRWVVGYSYVNDPVRERAQRQMMLAVKERWKALVVTAMQHVKASGQL